MHEARVLVVDDSAAMRALFSDILEQQRDVRVVGTAASADEARTAIAQLRPNVLTLDVEMPGMSGIEFLEEIMKEKPMPVVMLSGLTQSGTETSLKAYELGAVECFPKPLKATPDQFAKTVGKLGKIVLAAANSNLRAKPRAHAPRPAEAVQFAWNGHVVALSASMGGIDALSILLAHWPANCPPTVICLQAEAALVETFMMAIGSAKTCSCAESCRSSRRARTGRCRSTPTTGATRIATVSSACSASSNSNAASQPVTTRQSCRSRASSTSPHHVSG